MKTTLVSVSVEIPLETALEIIKSPSPLNPFRDYMKDRWGIGQESVTEYDLTAFRKNLAVELGEIELSKLSITTKLTP